MKRSLFTSIALTSVVLTSGVLQLPANAQNFGSIFNSIFQSPQPSTTQSTTQSTTPSLASIEKAVHNQVNQYRANRNLPPLSLNYRITEQARIHSRNMANGTVPFSHDGFNQRVQTIAKVIPLSTAAENVAYNQGYSNPATQAVQNWLNSSGHRANIEGSYNLTGVGVTKNARGEYYFTQIFIRSR